MVMLKSSLLCVQVMVGLGEVEGPSGRNLLSNS